MKQITFYKFSELSQEARNVFYEKHKERIAEYKEDYAHEAVSELKKYLSIVGLSIGAFGINGKSEITIKQLNPMVDFDIHSILEFQAFIEHAVPRLPEDTPHVILDIFSESRNDFKGRTANEYAQIFKDKFNAKNYTFSMEDFVTHINRLIDNSGLFTPDGQPCEICVCTDISFNSSDERFWWNDNDAWGPEHFPSTTEEYAESVREKQKAQEEANGGNTETNQ